MEIMNYIEPELFVIVPILYILGIMIKRSDIDDRWIPLILGIMGIILATFYKLSAHVPCDVQSVFEIIYAGVTQGLLCAAGSVYANNIVKQMSKDDEDTDKNSKSDNNGIF